MSERSEPRQRLLVRHLVACVGTSVLVVVVLVVAGWTPRVGYVLGLAAIAAFTTYAVRRIGETMTEAMWPLPFPPDPVTPGVDTRIGALESLLRRSADDAGIFERRLQPMLVDLASHRLRRDHGIDLAEQPDAARRLLGDAAWATLTVPPERPPTPAILEQAIASIERAAAS